MSMSMSVAFLSIHPAILPPSPSPSRSLARLSVTRPARTASAASARRDDDRSVVVRTPARRLLRCRANLLAESAPAVSAVYGGLLLAGGAFAYLRSGSKGSILGGVSGGALMAAAYYLMQSAETKGVGHAIGFGSAFLFACVFGIRFYNTKKLVPSGLLLVLSLGALTVFYSAYMQAKI